MRYVSEKHDSCNPKEEAVDGFDFWNIKPLQIDPDFTSKEKEVAIWLMKYPPDNKSRHWKGEPFPYDTYEEWAQAGREIKGAESILINFYENDTFPISYAILLSGLGVVGSSDSVPLLIRALKDETLDAWEIARAISSLGLIGDHAAVDPLCQIVMSTDYKYDSDRMIKFNAINCLAIYDTERY